MIRFLQYIWAYAVRILICLPIELISMLFYLISRCADFIGDLVQYAFDDLSADLDKASKELGRMAPLPWMTDLASKKKETE